MTTPDTDDDGLDPVTAELAERVRREAATFPAPEEIRDLAEEAVRHGGAPGMSSDEVRRLADKAIERAEQVTDLLRQLSTLLDNGQSGAAR